MKSFKDIAYQILVEAGKPLHSKEITQTALKRGLLETAGKTHRWHVSTKAGDFLGEVRWFSKWRKYSFFPAQNCVFEETCLGDIADFLKWATRSHKHGL